MLKIVCYAVFCKLCRRKIPVGPARTRWGQCFWVSVKWCIVIDQHPQAQVPRLGNLLGAAP